MIKVEAAPWECTHGDAYRGLMTRHNPGQKVPKGVIPSALFVAMWRMVVVACDRVASIDLGLPVEPERQVVGVGFKCSGARVCVVLRFIKLNEKVLSPDEEIAGPQGPCRDKRFESSMGLKLVVNARQRLG